MIDDQGQILAFGIPSLDELLGHPNAKDYNPEQFGIILESKKESTSLCLIGPDGTGKSVLAMHLASNYASQATDSEDKTSQTRILYVSTDLSYARAKATWENFALDDPKGRIEAVRNIIPPGRARTPFPRIGGGKGELEVALEAYHPLLLKEEDGTKPLTLYMTESPRSTEQPDKHRVAFIDLEANTAGDDWGLINRLLAALDKPEVAEETKKTKSRHLLIIDAVEGLETLGGQRDAFGHQRKRRSRIAQILRAAQGKCHVVFVVEEPREHERLPESFVSDAVIRLRVVHERDYDRRAIEIEKLRGQAYVRGQHDCLIRRGAGSKTGDQPNADHPDFEVVGKLKAYFQVMHSLQYLSREIMEKQSLNQDHATPDPRTYIAGKQPPGVCGFGIRYLDEMIGNKATNEYEGLAPYNDWSGLPWGSITSLIGDEGTHKGRLGRAFLAQAFRTTEGAFDADKGVALLLTTRYIDNEELASKFLTHHGEDHQASRADKPLEPEEWEERAKNRKARVELLKPRTFCRRLEIHYLSSAALFWIIHALVQKGLETLLDTEEYKNIKDGEDLARDPKRAHGRVRLVIDDWSGIQDAYPEIKADPLFLPFLIFYLQRQGITTLIIDTQPGRLGHILAHESDRELRALVPHHIYTWHVPFIGVKRVAIAAMPPVDDKKPFVVRELGPYQGSDEELTVDPHFEYYTGFEEDKTPHAVSLRVYLYQGEKDPSPYLKEVDELLHRLYDTGERDGVVRLVPPTGYNLYRDFVYLQGGSALEHSLVLQIDEFWSPEGGKVLSDLTAYLDANTITREGPDLVEDPFRLFQQTVERETAERERAEQAKRESKAQELLERDEAKEKAFATDEPLESSAKIGGKAIVRTTQRRDRFEATKRRDLFELIGHEPGAPASMVKDRIPYTVDFGFLLADQGAWENYRGPFKTKSGKSPGEIWDALAKPGPDKPSITWREMFATCLELKSGQPQASPTEYHAFDVERSTFQSFSCLVLEIWASEIFDERGPEECERILKGGLAELILPEDLGARKALFRAWLLINSVFNVDSFKYDGFQIRPTEPGSDVNPIASRHWYSTASAVVSKARRRDGDGPHLTPIRLPGHYTTRGDWFLGIAEGSRSQRLGERAIDLLSSRRANVTRMQTGIGLPVRGFPTEPSSGSWVDDEFRSIHLRRYGDTDFPDGRPMRLHEFWELGGSPSMKCFDKEYEKKGKVNNYYWLKRSQLRDYDRHMRIWSKWLIHTLREMTAGAGRDEGKKGMAWLVDYDDFSKQKNGQPSKEFERLCDVLAQALDRSTLST